MNIDELSPAYIGEDRILLSVDPSTPPRVGDVCQINVDYSGCEPEGTAVPMEMVIQGEGANGFQERTFRRRRPLQLLFVPTIAGEHLVILREINHNRWLGRLRVAVVGEKSEQG